MRHHFIKLLSGELSVAALESQPEAAQ